MSGPAIPKTKHKRIKPKRVDSPELRARIAMLPCVVCNHWPVEVHHIRATAGMGQRAGDDEAIPLCVWHHRTGPQAFHNGPGIFQTLFGTELELLEKTRERLDRP